MLVEMSPEPVWPQSAVGTVQNLFGRGLVGYILFNFELCILRVEIRLEHSGTCLATDLLETQLSRLLDRDSVSLTLVCRLVAVSNSFLTCSRGFALA
jgi:hypothetical protein